MADAVFSVRIDEELKNRFIELAQQNGINNKDLMQLMLTQFELGQISAGSNQFTKDIEELQHLTKRIADIYIHLVEGVQLKELEYKNKENQQLQKQQEEIEKLKEQLLQLEQKEQQIQQLKDQVKGLKQEVGVQKVVQRILIELNDLLRQKNSELEKNFVAAEVKIEAANEALEQLTKLKALVDDKEDEMRRLNSQLHRIKDEKEKQKNQFAEELKQKEHGVEQEVELLKRTQQLELQELRLSLQQDYNDKIEKLRDDYNTKNSLLVEENEQLKQRLNNQLLKGDALEAK